MERTCQTNTIKEKLDLTTGWKEITIDEVEKIINKKDKGAYWWFSSDKKWISTIKNLKVTNYKTSEVEVLYPKNREIPKLQEETKAEILTALLLDPTCKVSNEEEAYYKAKWSDHKILWYYSNGKDITILDFSKGKKPIKKTYPSNQYKLKFKTVSV